jgi:DNA-binding CsgD family transcriptional regulator
MPKGAHNPYSLGKLSILTIGFGLHNTWVYSTMFSTSSMFGTNINLPGIHGSDFSIVYVMSAVAFGTCLLIAAATDQKFLRFYVSQRTLGISALLASLSTLILVFPIDSYPLAFILEMVSGIITGLGSSILLLFWGIIFARNGAASIMLDGALSVIAGLIINALLLHTIVSPLGGLFTAAIPLIEWYILSQLLTRPNAEAPYFNPLPTNKSGLVFKLGVPVFVLGFALGILRQTSVQTTISSTTTIPETIMLLLAGCLSFLIILIFIVFLAMRDPYKWNYFFKIRFPVIVVSALFLSLIVSDSMTLSNLFLLMSYMCFEALMWMIFCCLSQRFKLSPVFVFGLGRGVLALASVIGITIPVLVSPWLDYASFGDNGLIFAVLVLMVIGYMSLPNEQQIESLIVRCPLARIISIELNEGINLLGTQRSFTTSSHQSGEGRAPLYSRQQEVDARRSEKETSGRFTRKVNQVAKTYLLTQRETDILFELAKGHGPTHLQKKYCISEGTAKTHIRNIYRKLNIHKREALMRLIEEIHEEA